MIFSASTGLSDRRDFSADSGQEIMRGDKVIEILNAGAPAWLAYTPPQELWWITFEINNACVFTYWPRARDTVSTIKCGFPQWECAIVDLTQEYFASFAKEVKPT